jgi:signal transduction histidine kinase
VLDEEGVQFLHDILHEAAQMAEVVTGLHRFSRIRTETDLTYENVDLDALVEDLHRRKNKRNEFQPGWRLVWDELPVVRGDRILLAELFANLIENGFKFNEADEPKVAIRYLIKGDSRVQIFVADNGIGIDHKYRTKLFTMFQRLHPTYPGTGVGLALVAAIVAKHGGTIEVDSAVGRGSVFKFDLPLATLDDMRPTPSKEK